MYCATDTETKRKTSGKPDTKESNRDSLAEGNPEPSILEIYMSPDEPFVDRFLQEPDSGVDVVIPVIHTNDLWRKNLLSIYREIPVNRLLLGDAGCIDKTLEIARDFPRVTVFDHRAYVSLGYSIRKLIEEVESDWFIYLHSDVYLPSGWFDAMKNYQDQYDWYECQQHLTVLLDYPLPLSKNRAYSGSQMGKTSAFRKVMPLIEDDFLYRNEDIIIAELIQKQGFRYGKVEEVCHYHQQMPKKSLWERKVQVNFQVERSTPEEFREFTMQAKGIVKYLDPSRDLAHQVIACISHLVEKGLYTWEEFEVWVKQTRPEWTPWIFSFSFRKNAVRHVLRDARGVLLAHYRLMQSCTALFLRCFQKLNPFYKKPAKVTRAA